MDLSSKLGININLNSDIAGKKNVGHNEVNILNIIVKNKLLASQIFDILYDKN
jgi:hypothetical protein